MPHSRNRSRPWLISPEMGLIFTCFLILMCCILPGTGVFVGTVRPPEKLLWSVCIAEGPDKIRVFARVDDRTWRPWPAEPSQVHNAAAIYEFVISPDGTISGVELPLLEGATPGWPDIVFVDKSDLYIFEGASLGRQPALYRIKTDGFQVLEDFERDEMFAMLQLNEASPSDARRILDRRTTESGWNIMERHGGVEDLDYKSNGFLVRITTESKGPRKSLLVTDMRTNEIPKCLLSVAGDDVQVELDGPENGSLAR